LKQISSKFKITNTLYYQSLISKQQLVKRLQPFSIEGLPRPPAEAENSLPLFPEVTFSFTSPVRARKSPPETALFLWQ